jgi:hypothetical protein
MESSNINQTWKSQTVVSEINAGRDFKNYNAANELTLLRDKQIKRALLMLPMALVNLWLALNSISRYFEGHGSPTNIISAFVLLGIVLLSLYQLYQLYQWRQAEIFSDTRSYLMFSRKLITNYIKRSEKSQRWALAFYPGFIAVCYYVMAPFMFEIFAVVGTLLFIIMLFRNKTLMRNMHNTYDPIVAKIDDALNALQSAQ